MSIGRRIVTLEKCFNVREGADRKLDDIPWRFMHDPIPSGDAKGMLNSEQEMKLLLDRYYELHDWDLETSWPYKETLERLDLSEVVAELQNLSRVTLKE